MNIHKSYGSVFNIPTNSIDSVTYSFITPESTPTIITLPVESVNPNSSILYGVILNDGGNQIISRGFCWSTNPTPTISNSLSTNGLGNGLFSENVSSLSPNNIYYVRAYATTSDGTTYGNELLFSTIYSPLVTTLPLYDIKGNSARASGAIINNGGDNITSKGFCWSTNPNPSISDNFTTSFDATMTGLISETTYYVRAYATNSSGTSYGNTISFNSGKLIGTLYAGGLVFYNDGNGHGLVCAESDQNTNAPWGCFGMTIGGTSIDINTGLTNTNAIVASCTNNGIAAKIAFDLVLNSYNDWFLPSKNELNLMYLNLKTNYLGGNWSSNYWSSSEYLNNASENACVQSFDDGSQGNTSKNQSFGVRAVRAF